MKLPEENIEETLQNTGIVEEFLYDPNRGNKSKNRQIELHQMKASTRSSEKIKRENIFHLSTGQGLKSRLYKDFKQLKTNN